MSKNVKIVRVRPAPDGFNADVLALVDFSYEPDHLDGVLEVTRYSKSKDRDYTIAKIAGAQGVMVLDANLRNGKNGPWIAVNGLSVPDEVRNEVARLAKPEFDRMMAPAPGKK